MCKGAEQVWLWRRLKAALASDCLCLVPGVSSYFSAKSGVSLPQSFNSKNADNSSSKGFDLSNLLAWSELCFLSTACLPVSPGFSKRFYQKSL